MNFTDELKLAKPTASAGTIKTYNSLLRNLYKKAFGETDSPNIENFKNVEKIMDAISKDLLQTQKTKLSAVMAIAPMPEYASTILRLAKENAEITESSTMTPKLEASEITLDEITTVMERLKKNADVLFKMTNHTTTQIQQIQDYVILSLYHGHISPRRAQDFIQMVLKPTDKTTQNYFDLRKSKFVFNIYKTANVYGTQEVSIPPALKKILTKWIKIIPTGVETLLFNSLNKPLTGTTLNQRLNNIFGGQKSVNSLRHFFLSEHHTETVRQMDDLVINMIEMGSNIRQAKSYIKINPLPAL